MVLALLGCPLGAFPHGFSGPKRETEFGGRITNPLALEHPRFLGRRVSRILCLPCCYRTLTSEMQKLMDRMIDSCKFLALKR